MGETITYEEGRKLQAGNISTGQRPLGIDTFYPGMLLEYDAVNDIYIALATDANMAAIYNGKERTLAAAGEGNVILGGEINEAGLVDAAGAGITLTEDQRATYRDKGFVMKRV